MGHGCIDPHFLDLSTSSRPGRFTPRERAPGTHWIGGWMGPRTGLDDMEKGEFLEPTGTQTRPLGCSAHGQSLYRLRYPDSLEVEIHELISPAINILVAVLKF
jgi:hypothetical protein